MKNKLDEIIKERLENRLEWRNYLGWLLTHKELSMKAKREFYRDKPLLNLILKLYFLPYNLMKFFFYMKDRHYFEMMDKEIEILNNEINNEKD